MLPLPKRLFEHLQYPALQSLFIDYRDAASQDSPEAAAGGECYRHLKKPFEHMQCPALQSLFVNCRYPVSQDSLEEAAGGGEVLPSPKKRGAHSDRSDLRTLLQFPHTSQSRFSNVPVLPES